MANPLTMRIIAKAELTALDDVINKLKGISAQSKATAKEAKGLEGGMDNLVEGLKKYANQAVAKKQGGLFGDSTRELSGLMSIFKTARRFTGVFGLISAPILLAQKNLIALDSALKPLNASLSQIGATSQVETSKLLGFITKLTSGTSTSIVEGVAALTVFVNKTKSTVDIEQTLSAAHVLVTATGMKFADATGAITNALDGDTAALANLTGKTKAQVYELVKSGQLVKTIQKDFKEASEKAQSGSWEFWKKAGAEASKILTASGGNLWAMLSRQDLEIQQQIGQTLKSVITFKKALQDLATTKISFATLDDFKINIAKTEGLLNQAKTVISSGLGTPADIGRASKVIPLLNERLRILQEQKKLQQELSLPERYQLTTTAAIVGLQADLYAEQNRSLATLDESNASLEEQKKIRGKIAEAQYAQIHAEAILGARQQAIAQSHELTPEQRISWATKELQKRNEIGEAAYKIEASKNIKILNDDAKLQRARLDLKKFYLQNQLRQYSSGYTGENKMREENNFTEKEVQFAIEAAKRKGLALLAEGRMTATEAETNEKELQLELTKIRQDEENTRSQETKDRMGRLEENQQARVLVLVNKIAKGSVSWTEEKELDDYKKISDEKLQVAKETDDALNKYFGEEVRITAERTRVPGEFVGPMQDMVKKARTTAANSKDFEELSNEFKNIFTPDEQATLDKLTALNAKLQGQANAQPVIIPVDFKIVGNMNGVIQTLITEFIRKLINGSVATTIGQGVEQGGSES